MLFDGRHLEVDGREDGEDVRLQRRDEDLEQEEPEAGDEGDGAEQLEPGRRLEEQEGRRREAERQQQVAGEIGRASCRERV